MLQFSIVTFDISGEPIVKSLEDNLYNYDVYQKLWKMMDMTITGVGTDVVHMLNEDGYLWNIFKPLSQYYQNDRPKSFTDPITQFMVGTQCFTNGRPPTG